MGKRGGKKMESAAGSRSAILVSLGGEADSCDASMRKSATANGGSGKEDRTNEVAKEGTFFLGEPTFLDLGSGRLQCAETGHELLAKDKEAYGRTKACRLGLIDAAVARKMPPVNMFQPHPTSRSQLVCKLTGDTVNKTEEHIWKHINGRRFLNKLEQKEMEMLASASVEKDTKIQTQARANLGSCKKDQGKDVSSNGSDSKKSKAEKGDMEELDFWMPPIGSRSDFDDGKSCWDSHTTSSNEADEVSGLDGSGPEDDPETRELTRRTKRMSIAVGPSSFASRKKKLKKATTTLPNEI